MADKHLFGRVRPDRNKLILHKAIPNGNNRVGISWADILVYAGISKRTELRASTKVIVMVDSGQVDPETGDPIMIPETTETVGVGQISDAERALIDSGDLMEISGVVKLDDAADADALDILADRLYSDWQAMMVEKYNYCGHTQG